MARLSITAAPHPAGTSYKQFKSWLLANFHRNLCSYCLLGHEDLEVEHYEPQSYAPLRINDPGNLLLGCATCNGTGGKFDYHPNHKARHRLPDDATGHLVIDIRADDFADLFEIDSDGTISGSANGHRARANWNITLLKLNRDGCNKARRELLELLAAAEDAVEALAANSAGPQAAALRRLIEAVIPDLTDHLLTLETYGINVSDALRGRLSQERARARGW